MTPAAAIAMLERQLKAHGEDVILRRYSGTGYPRPKTDISCRAFVRPVKTEQLVGTIDQSASNVVLSPTGLDALLPIVKGDKLVVQDRERNIEFPQPIFVAGTLVRIELLVMG